MDSQEATTPEVHCMNQQHPAVTRMDRASGAVGAPMSTPLVATGDAQPIVGRVIEGEILDISTRSLAAQVRAEHAATARAVVGGLQHAIRAGQLLSQARPRIEAEAERKKGAWGRWLRDECGIPDRTARLYIRLYQHRATLTDLGNAADLSMRAAVRLIAPRNPPSSPRNLRLGQSGVAHLTAEPWMPQADDGVTAVRLLVMAASDILAGERDPMTFDDAKRLGAWVGTDVAALENEAAYRSSRTALLWLGRFLETAWRVSKKNSASE